MFRRFKVDFKWVSDKVSEARSVVYTSLRELKVLFYEIKYVSKLTHS